MARLSVNVDHIATVREARKGDYPDPVTAALLAELAGAHGITVHLREDRRHIRERDVDILRRTLQTRLNLEMGLSDSVVKYALSVKPDVATIVPEKPGELTTEGGLDLARSVDRMGEVVELLHDVGVLVSLFVNPTPGSIRKAHRLGADCVELHTGLYAVAGSTLEASEEIEKIATAAMLAKKLKMTVHAGHDLTYENVQHIASIREIDELSIGHAIIARATLMGIEEAVRHMLTLLGL
jgi:pyridoxine 5-phosphate synthase